MSAESSLEEIRKKIDEIDTDLVRLLNDRADLIHEIGLIKKESRLPIHELEREEALVQGVITKSQGRMPENAIRAIYREIALASLALEKELCIAFLGPEASWTHHAARSKFGATARYSPQSSISDVFDRVTEGAADYGVVPIANSVEGVANQTLDVLMDSELKICAQILLRIENDLLSREPAEKMRKIYSHPQVFGECRGSLQEHARGLDLIEVSSTARAAQLAALEPGAAALANVAAAKVYGLTILENSVQDSSDNDTARFLVIAQNACLPTRNDKTSLMFCVQDRAGALYSALEPFSRLKLSMSKIVSRTSERKNWEHCFFVDIDGHCKDQLIREAIADLEKHCTFVKVLGSYPKAESVNN